jgi:hypothetical protein
LAIVVVACDPVEGTSRSRAPANVCPDHACELYPAGRTQAKCSAGGRCESGGFPETFVLAVNVPSTSFFSPGQTFLVSSNDLLHAKPPFPPSCAPPKCLALSSLGEANGAYFVKQVTDGFGDQTARAVGLLVPDGTSIPVRVQFLPLVPDADAEATDVGLPGGPLFGASRLFQNNALRYEAAIASGRYTRLAYPEPPYDAFYPPVTSTVTIPRGTLTDEVTISATSLDDSTGATRLAKVSRSQGLDGFRIWILDTATRRRVSVARPLHGTTAETTLHTIGQSVEGSTALREGLSVVVVPPSDWLAVPRLESELINGSGLQGLVYPDVPPPTSVAGVVVENTDSGLQGIPSRVTLSSTAITVTGGATNTLLRYETSVSTDAAGRFTTVMPPGVYDALVEPAEGTGFSKAKLNVEVGAAPLLLAPPRRSAAIGRAMLSDGRPLGRATVLATPAPVQSGSGVVPRGGRATTADDGTFRLELDLGSYAISVVPEEGTGFARTVAVRNVAASPQEVLGDLVVPPPAVLSFTLKSLSSDTGFSLPIAGALVRVFGPPTDAPTASPASFVEIGRGTADGSGKCEILLAQQPR